MVSLQQRDFFIWAGLLIFVLFIPVAKPPSTLGEILAILAWIPGFFHQETRSNRLQNLKSRPFLLFLPAFFLLHLIGMAWTSDLGQGLKELNMQHYLLSIPLIFASINRNPKKEKHLLAAFLIANLVASCLTIFIRQTDIPLLKAELYLPSPFIARPRASLFYAFSLFLLLEIPWHLSLSRKQKIFWGLATFIQAMALINLEGRTGQIAFALVLPVWMVMRLVQKHKILWFTAFTILVSLLAWLSYLYVGNIQRRFREAFDEVTAYQEGFKDRNANDTSFARRFVFMEKSWEVFTEHSLFGVGTGDLQKEVYPLFDNHPLKIEPNKPHHQFLEIAVKFGIFGLIFFLAGWIWQLIIARPPTRILFLCFSLLSFVSMMTESTMDTQAGISFFVFMGSLLLLMACTKPGTNIVAPETATSDLPGKNSARA